ncbi:AMIN-like domain-containing (lipo)protein [Actinopolymorpha singaporensis]
MTSHATIENPPSRGRSTARKVGALLAVSVLVVGLGACANSTGDNESGHPAAQGAPAGSSRTTPPATPTATAEPTATSSPTRKVVQVSGDDGSEPKAPTRKRELPVPTRTPSPAPVPAKVFSVKPRTNTSTARARLVGLTTARGQGSETVTFRFAGTEVVPKYEVRYVDVVRAHPEDDPIAVEGNAYLEVSFKLTNPNVRGRLAVPPDLTPGQPQVREILLVHNVAGSLKFGVGVTRRAQFRLHETKGRASLVLEVRDR